MAALSPAYSEETMTPESSEGRERITRLEERVDSNRRQIEMLGPLPRAVERVQWNLDELAGDFKEFRVDYAARQARHEQKVDDTLERLAQSFSGQIASCSDRIAKMSEAQQAWQEAERERRENAQKTEKQDRSSDKASRRAMWGLVGAAAVTGFLGLITQVITALS